MAMPASRLHAICTLASVTITGVSKGPASSAVGHARGRCG